MGLKEEVIEMKKEVQEVKEQSLASEIISDYKKAISIIDNSSCLYFIILSCNFVKCIFDLIISNSSLVKSIFNITRNDHTIYIFYDRF